MRNFTLSVEGQEPIKGILVENDVQLYQICHDFETPEGIRDNAPCPEVNRLEPHVGILLTEELQWFWFDLLMQWDAGVNTEDVLKQKWRALTAGATAFTNGRGTDTCRDYISNRNMDKVLPMFYPLVCGGNVVTGEETVYKQIPCLLVETINTSSLNGITRELTPYLIQCATIIQEDGRVTRFPELNGRDVPVPILGAQPIYYPLAYMKKLLLGSPIPSPYRF